MRRGATSGWGRLRKIRSRWKVVVDSSAPQALRKGWRWWQVGPGPTCHHLQKHQGESRSDEESTTTFPTGSNFSEAAPGACCAPPHSQGKDEAGKREAAEAKRENESPVSRGGEFDMLMFVRLYFRKYQRRKLP